MININIPNIPTASLQPDFTKFAKFPGFVFYHSLKEWYFIKNDTSITIEPDYLLDELNLAGSFSYLIGNNSSVIFIAQPETSQLLRLQINPNTANIISRQTINIKSIVESHIGESREVGITSGFVFNNYVILGCAVTEGNTVALRGHKPYILFSEDNGVNFTVIEISTTPFINSYLTPTGIARINFYNTYYYVFFLSGYNTNNFYLYIVSEEELFNNQTAPEYLQTSPVGYTFGDPARKHINRQFVWNHNKLYTLSDDRTQLIKFDTGLHKSSSNYPTQYPVLPFNITQENIVGEIFTQIQEVPNNNTLTSSTRIFKKQNNLTNGVSPGFSTEFYNSAQLWDEVTTNLGSSTSSIIDFAAYTDEDFIILTLDEVAGVQTPRLNRNNFNGTQASTNLREVPLTRFNTGGIHWTGEVVDASSEPLWNQDVSIAQWLSHDEDTFIIDYGSNDFDYILTMNIDLPVASTITGTIWVDDQVTDILVDGNSQGLTYAGPGGNGNLISLALPAGPSTVTFQIKNQANSGYNPTGIKVRWDNLLLPSIDASFSDIYVDTEEDRLYVSLGPFAWILELSSLTKLACINLLAEELPGGPFLIPTGVNQTEGTPIKWKWIKEFDDVYIYNEYHNTTYTSTNDKFFYTWKIDTDDPSYHEMYSAFELDVTTCTHIHYFFALNNELHGILSSRNTNLLTSNFKSTQYRIAGLANFAQVTSNPVTAGPFVTQDVFVANDGKVYLSKSAEPSGYTDSNTNLFVYVNDSVENLSAGSYVIVIDDLGNPYNFDTFESFSAQPYGYNSLARTNFDKIAKFIQIPGDYSGSTIINSTKFRDELFVELPEQFGNTNFNQQRLVFNPTNEDFVIGKVGMTQHWAYFIIYNNVNSNYRLVRTRTVFYATT